MATPTGCMVSGRNVGEEGCLAQFPPEQRTTLLSSP